MGTSWLLGLLRVVPSLGVLWLVEELSFLWMFCLLVMLYSLSLLLPPSKEVDVCVGDTHEMLLGSECSICRLSFDDMDLSLPNLSSRY